MSEVLLTGRSAPLGHYNGAGTGHRPSVVLYGPDGNELFPASRAAADNNAIIAAPDVNSVLTARDAAGTLDMLRTGKDADGGVLTAGVLAVVPHFWQVVGQYGPMTAAEADNYGTTRAPLMAPALWDSVNSAFNRQRPNIEGTLLASAARTATVSSAPQTNYNGRGVRVFIDVTASAATPSVVFTVEVADPISGTYTAVLTSAAITGAGHTVLRVYPGITAAANLAASDILGRTWRVTATHGDADSITYSVGYALLV